MLIPKIIDKVIRRVTIFMGIFARCFYSPTLYRQVSASWKGLGIAYLFLAVMIWSVPDMVRQHRVTKGFIDSYVTNFISQIPEMELRSGNLTVKSAMPHYVKDPVSGAALIIIDTAGKVTSLENETAKILLTDTQVIYNQGSRNIKHVTYGQKFLLIINREILGGLLAVFEKWFLPAYVVAIVGAKSILFGLLAMVGVVAGTIYARLACSMLSLLSIARIAAVAVTPAVIIYSLMELGLIHIPAWWIWALIISCVYTLLGVRSNIVKRHPRLQLSGNV